MFKKLPSDATLKDVIAQVNKNSAYLKNFESFCDEGYFEEEFEKLLAEVVEEKEDGYGDPYRVPAIEGFPQPKVGFAYKTTNIKELTRLRKSKKGIFVKI